MTPTVPKLFSLTTTRLSPLSQRPTIVVGAFLGDAFPLVVGWHHISRGRVRA